jgi:LPXTG-motif cell wall-anchored protein
MKRSNQGGAILGFIVVGVILLATLLGAVYFVSHQNAGQTMPEAPQQTPVKKPENKPSNDKAVDANPKKEDANVQTPSTAELPQTGPAETLGTVLIFGVLSGALVSYLRSRRQAVLL